MSNKLKGKLITRNNLLSRLTTTSWVAYPKTLKQMALAMCYSTAEYYAPVWARSCHAHKVDLEPNKSRRIITGTLKSTPLPALYRRAGIPPPYIQREIITKNERHKQLNDLRYSLYRHHEMRKRGTG